MALVGVRGEKSAMGKRTEIREPEPDILPASSLK